MIKVRLYTEEAYVHALGIDGNGHHDSVFDYESSFDSVLYNLHESYPLPFRDAESLRLLKEVENITFINDDDWYTVMWDSERTCIAGIPKSLKFALMAVEHSRDGRYTWFYPVEENIWSILADMPFDILIGLRMTKTGVHHANINGADYEMANYPYEGKELEVTVKKEPIPYDDDFYTEIPKGNGLYLGKDGRYYLDSLDVGYALQYFWENDIRGIVEYIGKKNRQRLRLVEIHQEYNIFEFAKALGKEENEILQFDCMRELASCIVSEEALTDDSYQEYLYFRDKFQVISHITIAPGDTTFRRLPVLMVDKNRDGSYWVHGDLTYRYPDFCNVIRQVIEERNRDGERLVLIIDKEELLDSVEDLDCAVYGFQVMPDRIEVFDIEDAILLFGQMLEEAVMSGRCNVDDEFYERGY